MEYLNYYEVTNHSTNVSHYQDAWNFFILPFPYNVF